MNNTMTPVAADRLQSVLEKAGGDSDLAGVMVRIESRDHSFGWTGSVGELDPTTPFFIASTTKLYTSAIVLRLADRGGLSLDGRLVDLVDAGLVRGLSVYRGTDHTDQITVRHLLAHTSGLPDYFMGKRPDGKTLEHKLRSGADLGWTLDEVLGTAREMGAVFPPGQAGKALYSDTNFQLLGRMIEDATGLSYHDALHREILEPLRLERTWLYTDPADTRPIPLRDGRDRLHIPKAMASFGPDGGVVATVADLMRFLRGFWEGDLFDPAILPTLKMYNRIFYPLQYGVGFARFKLPRVYSPFAPLPELIGHSGLSGAFAFLAPDQGVYLAGTVNNLAKPGRSYRLMLRLLRALG
jgi:CubicO group peptidase (beta-lactamase class C family)